MNTTTRSALVGRPIRDALNGRDRALDVSDTARDARMLLANPSVTVVPVLDEGRYVGVVDGPTLDASVADGVPLGRLARHLLPTAVASEPAEVAFARADDAGALRLVVLDADGSTYRGLVCLRSDGLRLCIDAECHA
jgi:CBS domain-containing protein